MAMLDSHRILRIKVLEDSAECGVFVISVYCGEPLLLSFWCRKPPFRNGQVEQTEVNLQTVAKVDFVLRALDRAPNLPNSHYWAPFVLALCLDALPFRFRLPAEAHGTSRIQDIIEECGELTLLRLDGCFSDSILGFKCLYEHHRLCTGFSGSNCGLSHPSTLACYACPPKDKPPQHHWLHRTDNSGQSPGCFMMGQAHHNSAWWKMKEQQRGWEN